MINTKQVLYYILLFIIINIIIPTVGLGQSNAYYDNLELLLEETSEGADARFKHILRTEFSQLINTNSNGLLGNYVGLSTKDETLSFAFNRVVDKGIVELNASGTINDNIAGILAQNKFKTGVELGLKFHKIIGINKLNSNYLTFSGIGKELKDLKNNRELFKRKFPKELRASDEDVDKKQKDLSVLQKKYFEILSGGGKNTPIDVIKNNGYQIQIKLIEAEIKLLDDKIRNFNTHKAAQVRKLQKKRDDPKNFNSYKEKQFIIDSLKLLNELRTLREYKFKKNKELVDINRKIKENTITEEALNKAKNDLELAQINLKIAEDKYEYLMSSALATDQNKFVDDRKKVLDKLGKIRAENIHLFWISFAGSLANETYKVFDSTKLLQNQISNEEDLIPTFGVSFSMYRNEKKSNIIIPSKDRKIILWVIGAEWKYGNNINTLQQIEIQSVDTIASNRTIINSQKVFNGAFNDEIDLARVFIDHYSVGWSSQNLGFHFRATIDIGPQIPVYSARAGIVFSVKKKEDIRSNVNFELFLGLNDLFKKDGEGELFLRNIIGLQTTVPFTF